jgi:hypothetical protein
MTTAPTQNPLPRAPLMHALRQFIRARPGLEFGNYGDVTTYRAESRRITRDLHHAEALLNAVVLTSISVEDMIEISKRAFGGRLSITPTDDGFTIDYCTGQYRPTEYRCAVCSLCVAALWSYWRDQCGYQTGDEIRVAARRHLSKPLAQRWFA